MRGGIKIKKIVIGILTIMALLFILGFGTQQYINSTTIATYGELPSNTITAKFDKVKYTIPTIDEEGNHSPQTFTIDADENRGTIIKLKVRHNKVKDYEFVEKKDVPKNVRKELAI